MLIVFFDKITASFVGQTAVSYKLYFTDFMLIILLSTGFFSIFYYFCAVALERQVSAIVYVYALNSSIATL